MSTEITNEHLHLRLEIIEVGLETYHRRADSITLRLKKIKEAVLDDLSHQNRNDVAEVEGQQQQIHNESKLAPTAELMVLCSEVVRDAEILNNDLKNPEDSQDENVEPLVIKQLVTLSSTED